MIRKLISRIFKAEPASAQPTAPKIIPQQKHGISPNRISRCALKVIAELQQAGFAAFIVGGAVRDLLLGKQPKDFDVATDATPEEVHRLFRRSRLIGRRFRIVHVMCGQETIEVSTFRAVAGNGEDEDHQADESGRILRDNVFGGQGGQAEDALRRDFTVNALYYDPTSGEIWDYHNGVVDLKAGMLRIIGDPVRRYREDPMRMLRAVRLAAKLELKLDPATRAPIRELADLLQQVPPARLFDEMLKLLLSGHAVQSVKRLRAEGLHHGLLPMLDVVLEQPLGERFVMLALKNTDERVLQDKPVSPAFLFATLLWHEVLTTWNQLQGEGESPVPALHQAMDQVVRVQAEKLAIPRRFGTTMKEIWGMQPRFLHRSASRPFRLLEHPRFRAAYDFLQLRCDSGELDAELGRWWAEFQEADEGRRREMLVAETVPAKRRRRRSRRKPAASPAPEANDTAA